MTESTWNLKLLRFTNKYPLIKDLKSFSANLNLFCIQELELSGSVFLEIPKQDHQDYKWRVVVNRELWRELEGEFESFDLRKNTNCNQFTFFEIGNQNFGILKVSSSSTHIGFYILPIKAEHSGFREFFGELRNLIEGRIHVIKEYMELNNYKELIFKDDITNLFNQRKLDHDLIESIKRYEMNAEPFYVLFIDIDHFKVINDGHGHLVGTSLLEQVGETIKGQFRECDFVYRYGGDEFVVIVRDVTKEKALEVSERLLEFIKNKEFIAFDEIDKKQHSFKISASIGVAGYPEDATEKREILAIADKMMYEAKKGGRGRVCLASNLFKKDAG